MLVRSPFSNSTVLKPSGGNNMMTTNLDAYTLTKQKLFQLLIRFTEHPNGHIKVGPVNFWPRTGTITIDNIGRARGEGFGAFIRVIKSNPAIWRGHSYGRPPTGAANVVPFRQRNSKSS
jgi:hypothetical protein